MLVSHMNTEKCYARSAGREMHIWRMSLFKYIIDTIFTESWHNVFQQTSTYHSSFSEVYSNCSDELGVETAIRVLVQEAGLSHTRVPEG